MAATERLLEWGEHYLRYRDSLTGDILSIKRAGLSLHVERKSGKQRCVIAPNLADVGEGDTIITLNNRRNVDRLATQWATVSRKRLTIIFANPLSDDEMSWTIKPHIHARICGEKNLKRGLASMAALIPAVTEEEL